MTSLQQLSDDVASENQLNAIHTVTSRVPSDNTDNQDTTKIGQVALLRGQVHLTHFHYVRWRSTLVQKIGHQSHWLIDMAKERLVS